MVRLVSSGTEAAMSAIRLARGATRRDRVLKFAGCYHGHADALLAEAGSGVATLGIPSSAGVPAKVTADTIVSPYNDLDAAAAAVAQYGEGLACVIVEPVAGNMGVVPPAPGFLEGLRALCDASGALLVFDEVITGFRLARGGAQERFGVLPDLTILGKIVGGGLPLAAFGGRADVMQELAPTGTVYQAGTLSGNPLATAAGLAVLRRLRDDAVYEELERRGARLEAGLAPHGRFARVGAMATLFAEDSRALRGALPPSARAGRLRRAVAVRGDVRLPRARRRGDREDGRRGCRFRRLSSPARCASRPRASSSRSSRRLAEERYALGLETIYEGYLVHYGRPRLFEPEDDDTALVLGDYLYAQGLARIASLGDVDAVRDLAELISLCAQARADGRDGDGAAWAATAALIGQRRLDAPRAELRDRGDAGPLERLAREAAGDESVDRALEAHARLVG